MPKKGQYIDLKGQKFGKLKVIEFYEKTPKQTKWLCECECGNQCVVYSSHLKSGHTKSCGCISKERIKNLNFKTGLSQTKLYRVYRNMLNRCYWEKSDMFKHYGARGIEVCDDWKNKENGFEVFSEWAFNNGYNEGLTLDRIDCNKGYCPENCRWVDAYVQANNKRKNWYLKINGEIDTVGNWARRLNISYWNLLHYAKGGKNMKYPDLEVESVNGL